jgi:hypothetical protein
MEEKRGREEGEKYMDGEIKRERFEEGGYIEGLYVRV